MLELYEKYKKFVADNYKGELDERVLEALSIAIMGHFLRNEKLAKEKLPEILQDLTIIADKKTCLQIAHDNFPNFDDDAVTNNTAACIYRCFGVDEKNGGLYEDTYLFASLLNYSGKKIKLIEAFTHELTHSLRDRDYCFDGKELSFKGGICVSRVPDVSDVSSPTKRKHFILEEAIVQRYTLQILHLLQECLKDEKVPLDSGLYAIKKANINKECQAYGMAVNTMDYLCKDAIFNELVEESFENEDADKDIASYYNRKVDDSLAFTQLSKTADACYQAMESGNKRQAEALHVSCLEHVKKFLFSPPAKKYNK